MPIASMILSRLSPAVTWPVPQDVVICSVDPSNGKLAGFWSDGKGVSIPYIRGTEPQEVSEENTPWVWSVLKSLWDRKTPDPKAR